MTGADREKLVFCELGQLLLRAVNSLFDSEAFKENSWFKERSINTDLFLPYIAFYIAFYI